MNFPIWNYPYAACFASASLVLSPKGDMGISASLLRSIFSFNLRLRGGLRPLRSKAPLFIVLSPVFYLADKKLPPEGAWAGIARPALSYPPFKSLTRFELPPEGAGAARQSLFNPP